MELDGFMGKRNQHSQYSFSLSILSIYGFSSMVASLNPHTHRYLESTVHTHTHTHTHTQTHTFKCWLHFT
jgi:hypothetical protein